MDQRWTNLLRETQAVHKLPTLQKFCPFPTPLAENPITPYKSKAADLMLNDRSPCADHLAGFREALIDAGPLAQWRETYKGGPLGQDFEDSFACYEILGRDAPFATDQMRGFVLYFPAGLHYPWHHHPAEELYLVVAGQGEFAISGEEPRMLSSGNTIYHRSNIPHALTTHDQPIMTYVLWRGDLTTKPVLTAPEVLL